MRLLALLAAGLFAGSLIAADDKKDDKKGKDEEAIIGSWKIDALDLGVKDGPSADALKDVRMVFKKEGKLGLVGPDGKAKDQEYKLDPAAKMKAIDIVADGKTVPGLYELDGDTLKLCIFFGPTTDKVARPTEFKADGKGVAVLTLKRVKEEKKDGK